LKSLLIRTVPQAHLFGHVHEDYGIHQSGELQILSINSSCCGFPVKKIIHFGHYLEFLVSTTENNENGERNEFAQLLHCGNC
jgi:hypothetical protein